MDAIDREESFELGQKWFARDELELRSEQSNPRYFERISNMPWWPDVARNREQALSRMRERSAELQEYESPRMKEAEESYWSEEKARLEEARLRRDEYLEEKGEKQSYA